MDGTPAPLTATPATASLAISTEWFVAPEVQEVLVGQPVVSVSVSRDSGAHVCTGMVDGVEGLSQQARYRSP
jgi:hypothetical protein